LIELQIDRSYNGSALTGAPEASLLNKDYRWNNNGTAICIANYSQAKPDICSDGAGGAIITWHDYRNGNNNDIYAQRINSTGVVQWGENGIIICNMSGNQENPRICSDGVGGAIISWEDWRGGSYSDVYAQRVNLSGAIIWTLNGVPICTASDNQNELQLCSDGAGGAIITWTDFHVGSYPDVYAQKINSLGTVVWTTNGIAMCNTGAYEWVPQICSDGSGGAIITWQYWTSGPSDDIYANRVTSAGTTLWGGSGIAISASTNDQRAPQICSDDLGGAIISWHDGRSGNYDIYAQRVNSGGTAQWSVNGVPVCIANNDQTVTQICRDGVSGAIITWCDKRSGNNDIYSQRIYTNGTVSWTINGVPICIAENDQYTPRICSDGAEGAIITWVDARYNNYDIFAQHINSIGLNQWNDNGTAICTADYLQAFQQLSTDGVGGAIVTWVDNRSGSHYDIYAQRVITPTAPILNVISPNPDEDGIINLDWNNVSGATTYYVYRNTSTISLITGLTPITTVSTSAYTDNITSDGTYYYVIVAGNVLGNSSISNCENVTVTFPVETPVLLWNTSWGTIDYWGQPANEKGYAATIDQTGNIYIAGQGYWVSTDQEILKFWPNGTIRWKRNIGSSSSDWCRGIALDSAQNFVYVGGSHYFDTSSFTYDPTHSKFNVMSSNWEWYSAHWPSTGSITSYGMDIDLDSSSYAYVVGYTTDFGTGWDGFLIKWDDTTPGGPYKDTWVWSRTWDGGGDDYASAVVVNRTTNVIYVAGYSFLGGNYDITLRKYNSSGNLLWNRTWDNSIHDQAYGIALDNLGNIYISGTTNVSGSHDSVLIKYDAAGNYIWNTTWGGSGDDVGYAVTTSSLGYIYIGGYTDSYGAVGTDTLLLKYDLNGLFYWNATWNGYNNDYGRGVVVDDSENIFITGETQSFGAGDTDFLILKYNIYSIPKTPTLDVILPNPDDDGLIELNWNDVDQTITYYVFRDTSNIVSVTGLTPIAATTTSDFTDTLYTNGTYYYVIVAGNSLGNSSISNCENVTLTFPPPSVNILSPGNGSQYEEYANIPIIANVTDKLTITQVQLYVNNTYVANLQFNGSLYLYNWNTTIGFNGINFLNIKAYNIKGLVNSDESVLVNITLYIPPAEHADIYNATATNSTGQPQENYTRGEQVIYHIIIRGDLANGTYVITAQTDDPLLQGYLSYNETVQVTAGEDTKVIFYFNIPSGVNVPTGTYTVQFIVWTNWPWNGGLAVDFIIQTFTVT